MQESITYVGLDVHKDSIVYAVAPWRAEVQPGGQIANRTEAIRGMVERLSRRHGRLSFTYEAGPCGYDLYRWFLERGHPCLVVAPSLIPRRPGDRIKTDRRDAMTLARLSRSGDLTAVWVPDPHHESIRELVRCREDFKQAERRCRQRMCSFLLRHGRYYEQKNWTQAHRRWLRSQQFQLCHLQETFDALLFAIEEAEQRVVQMERRMESALTGWSLTPLVRGLMALRGVRLITGMTLVAELGDIRSRFRMAQELMAFTGLVPGERSSGQTRRQLGITKSGNRHVRRVLVESAWAYRHKPAWTQSLLARARDASEEVCRIAWKAQKRLHRRYHRMMLRGKPGQVAVTAVARELVGFVWAIAGQVMAEQNASVVAGV
jgi:transposase